MAELALSAFAAAGTASATAATSAAAWAAGTTITTAAGATSSLIGSSAALGTLGTIASVGSMVATLVGGYASYRQASDSARVAELNADGARLEADEKALRIRRELVQKVGSARVAFAGSGADISSGQAIEDGYRHEAEFETSLARTGGEIAAASGRAQAAQSRARGSFALAEAAGRAGGAYAQNRISLERRG
jgi:hypothetical protein